VRYLNQMGFSLLLALAMLAPSATTQAAAPSPEPGMTFMPGQGTDWREEYAYTLGVQA